MRYKVEKLSERFWTRLAWAMPRQLVYWCAIRLMAHATTGKYGSQHPESVSIVDALKRWDEPAESITAPPTSAIA